MMAVRANDVDDLGQFDFKSVSDERAGLSSLEGHENPTVRPRHHHRPQIELVRTTAILALRFLHCRLRRTIEELGTSPASCAKHVLRSRRPRPRPRGKPDLQLKCN